MADDALARRLHARADVRDFAALALSEAAARGIAVAAETLAAAAAPDPLGIAAFATTPASGTAWPGADWLPVQVVDLGGQVFVDWLYFGARPLREPFFEDSVRRALRAPFNRAFRFRLALADFLAGAAAAQSLKPSGLIFHMSRAARRSPPRCWRRAPTPSWCRRRPRSTPWCRRGGAGRNYRRRGERPCSPP